MKKWVAGILAAGLLTVLGTTGAMAAGTGRDSAPDAATPLQTGRTAGIAAASQRNFTDKDGDGVCDLYQTGAGRNHFIDENGDGICDLCPWQEGAGCTAGRGCGARASQHDRRGMQCGANRRS